MNDLFNYKDYRQFLLDFLAFKRGENSWYSIRYFSEKIGMDHGNLVRVLQGKRGLPNKVIPPCCKQLNLTGRKAEYFRLLVFYQKCKNPEKASEYLEKLLSLVGQKNLTLEANQFKFYSQWYHNAIYHLLGSEKWDGDYELLAKKLTPPISETQAKSSIKLLQDLNLIEVDNEGNWIQAAMNLTTGDVWSSTYVHNFQKTTLEMAINSLERHHRNLRDFSTLTIGVNHKDLEKIQEVLKDTRRRIIDIVKDSEPVDCVYQLNFQLFPMAFNKKFTLKLVPDSYKKQGGSND